MLERTIIVVNPLGLHARAAAKLVRLSRQFESRITLRRQDMGTEADAKEILSVLHIAASCGISLRVVVDGSDETAASDAIQKLFGSGFGET